MSSFDFEDIARFVEGDMTEQERQQFSAQLENDHELAAKLREYQHIDSSLRMKLVDDSRDQVFKASLDTFGKEYFRNSRVIPLKRYITWAASIAAVFVVFLIWSPWKANMYEQYAATSMPATAERGEVSGQGEMQEAATAFNRKDFNLAKSKLETVLKSEPANNMAKLYYGISLIETGQTVEARKHLLQVFNGESVFKYDAGFYIALSYLKEKKEKECALWLKKIPADAPNYEKAQELFRKLK